MKKSARILALLLAILLVLGGLLLPIVARAAYDPPTPSQVCQSVVRIAALDESGQLLTLGSGFAVGQAAPVSHIATSYHVVQGYEDKLLVWIGEDDFIPCRVAVTLSAADIAVLALASPIDRAPLVLGDSDMGAQGDSIYTFGFPDYDLTDKNGANPEDVSVTSGVISKKTTLENVAYYQVDAAVNPGNSGGPLWHADGCVIGITTIRSTQGEGINGAVNIGYLTQALDSVQIPYLLYSDLMGGSFMDSKTLLIIGICLAALAVALMVVALYLRMRDRTPSDASQADKRLPMTHSDLKPIPMPQADPEATIEKTVDVSAQADRPVVCADSGFFKGVVVPVSGQLAIGRSSASCQLTYPLEMTEISRVHVKVTYDPADQSFTLTDSSTNGTFLADGTRLVKGEPKKLPAGAQFYLSTKDEMYSLNIEENK